MPKYMLVLRGDTTVDYSQFSPADFQHVLEQFNAWQAKLASQGLLVDGKKLQDSGGKVLTPGPQGKLTVKDGPYLETKEVVGGYYVIKADSYQHAVELCRDHPNLQFGSVEIREVDFLGAAED